MLIWRGYGFLTIILAGISFVLVELVVGKEFYNTHNWVHMVGYIIAGVLCYFVGKELNKNKDKIYVDKESGKEVMVRNSHSFIFIKMEYWGFIFPIVGIINLFMGK